MKRILKPLLYVAGALFALVLLTELVLRIAFPVPMEPARLQLTNDIPGVKRSVDFRFDSDRMRSANWSKRKKTDNYRVLCLGGNGTTALLQSVEDTWWGSVGKRLEADLGKPVEVAAPANVPEGRILPGVIVAEKLLARYRADLIVIVFGFSDMFATPGDYKFDPNRLERLRGQEPIGLKYQLAKASHILRIIRNARTARGQRIHQEQLSRPNYYRDWLAARAQHFASRPMVEGISRSGDDPLDEYLAGIEAFAKLAEEHGAKLLVVGEPTLYKSSFGPADASRLTVLWQPVTPAAGQEATVGLRVRPLAVETELQRFYNAAAQKCASLGVAWVNLQGEIPRFVDYFVSETYLTDQGCAAVAAELAPPISAVLRGVPIPASDDTLIEEISP